MVYLAVMTFTVVTTVEWAFDRDKVARWRLLTVLALFLVYQVLIFFLFSEVIILYKEAARRTKVVPRRVASDDDEEEW